CNVAGSGRRRMSASSARARPCNADPSNGSPTATAASNRWAGSSTELLVPNTSTNVSRTQRTPTSESCQALMPCSPRVSTKDHRQGDDHSHDAEERDRDECDECPHATL